MDSTLTIQLFLMPKCAFIFSGCSSYRKRLAERGIVGFHELLSYYELAKRKNCWDEINELQTKRGMIMLDSGAFSAFTKNEVIDVQAFIRWHKQLEKECPTVKLKAGLDDIKDCRTSIVNQEATDAAGLDLFPTYHRNDPDDYLAWLLSRSALGEVKCNRPPYDYVGLGGIATGALHESDKIALFLDDAYTAICDPEGRPKLRSHLFGISNISLLQLYPGWSNDSTSALMTALYGSIWVPQMDAHSGILDWSKPMIHLTVSDESNARGKANTHYLTLKPAQKEIVRQFVASRGFDIEKVMSDAAERQCFCHIMLMEQAANYPENVRFKAPVREHSLFD